MCFKYYNDRTYFLGNVESAPSEIRKPTFSDLNFSKAANSVDTGRKLNAHKTFRRLPGRLLNVLCTFNLRPASIGKHYRVTANLSRKVISLVLLVPSFGVYSNVFKSILIFSLKLLGLYY